MADSIYYCTKENNNCPKKDLCRRYIDSENKDKTTLFKMACTNNNNYVLFMQCEDLANDTLQNDTLQESIDKSNDSIKNENKESDI